MIAILFMVLWNISDAMVIPLSMFFTFASMVQYKVSANLLSLRALTGVEGKMFKSTALTVVISLVGTMILSVKFIPAAAALFIGKRVSESENFLMRGAKCFYAPALDWVMQRKAPVLGAALAVLLLCGLLVRRLGSEFVPSLNEGDMVIPALRMPAPA